MTRKIPCHTPALFLSWKALDPSLSIRQAIATNSPQMITTQCPPAERIANYLDGRCETEEYHAIERHLAGCAQCESLAEECSSGQQDSLLRHLRLASPTKQNLPHETIIEESPPYLDSLYRLPDEHESQDLISRRNTPQTIYHYRLEKTLGQGGMGVVYQSTHPGLHRPVAIKLLPPARSLSPDSVTRFQREMRAIGALDHPGIVRALDAGVWEGTHYLVMEFVDGIDCSRLLRCTGPMDAANAAQLIADAAVAVHAAHQANMVHRDIKPSNIMLSRDGVVKVLDFGLARLEADAGTRGGGLTAGQLVGTLDFLPPELITGNRPADPLADIYSLGATLYNLLTGRPPYGNSRSRKPLDHLQLVTSGPPVSVAEFRSDLPPDLTQLIDQTLDPTPSNRPASALMLAEALTPFTDSANLASLATEMGDRASDRENDSFPDNSRDASPITTTKVPQLHRQDQNDDPVGTGTFSLSRWDSSSVQQVCCFGSIRERARSKSNRKSMDWRWS